MADKSSETTHLIANQPYDESVSVYDDEEVTSLVSPSPRAALPGKKTNDPMGDREHLLGSDDDNEFEHDDGDFSPRQPVENGGQNIKPAQQKQRPAPSQNQRQPSASSRSRPPPGGHVIEASDDDDDDDDDGDQSESSEDEDGKVATTEGTYDPAEYEHLPVSQEIKELFQYITRYTPQAIDLDYKLRPFIPDYIPAVGDIDAFLKVARPDGKPETLGLFLLDEPSAKQSDPTVLDLQLRSISKQTNVKQVVVRSIDEPGKNPKAIDNWITSITDLHRQKPPQNVHYTKKMPDIETLMQEWPPEFEELLKTANLPSAELDCDLHFNQLANNNLLSNELKQHDPMSRKAKSENTESLSFD